MNAGVTPLTVYLSIGVDINLSLMHLFIIRIIQHVHIIYTFHWQSQCTYTMSMCYLYRRVLYIRNDNFVKRIYAENAAITLF